MTLLILALPVLEHDKLPKPKIKLERNHKQANPASKARSRVASQKHLQQHCRTKDKCTNQASEGCGKASRNDNGAAT
jgi:hypothetical protein